MSTQDVVCYYYEPVKAPLLREAVLPALHDVPVAAHVERGWLHGPHLRVRLTGERDEVTTAADRVCRTLSDYLRRHPSRATVSTTALLERAVAAGRAELVPPPYEPIHPDNTVRVEPADLTALTLLLGGRSAVAVRAELLRIGVEAVAATMRYLDDHGDTSSARVQAAIAAMTAHAARSPRGLDNGYLSFRSHLEGFLKDNDESGELRGRHRAVWERHADRITARVARCAEPGGGELVSAWSRWSAEARRLAAAAHDRDGLSFASPGELRRRAEAFGDPALLARWEPDGPRDLSEFHLALGPRQLDASAQRLFDASRFCVNVFYLLLAVCDVTSAERYLAASLVSEAVERLAGQSWQERFGRTAAGGVTTRPRTEPLP